MNEEHVSMRMNFPKFEELPFVRRMFLENQLNKKETKFEQTVSVVFIIYNKIKNLNRSLHTNTKYGEE